MYCYIFDNNNLNLGKLSVPSQKVETDYANIFQIQYWSGTPRRAYNSEETMLYYMLTVIPVVHESSWMGS